MHRLALALGRTVSELRATLTFNELRAWEEYYRLEPWGATRDNMHAGMIAAAIVNPTRKRGTRALSFSDFMLKPASEKYRDNRKRFKAAMKALATKRGE